MKKAQLAAVKSSVAPVQEKASANPMQLLKSNGGSHNPYQLLKGNDVPRPEFNPLQLLASGGKLAVQRVLSGPDKVSLNSKFGKNQTKSTEYLNSLNSATEVWKKLNAWVIARTQASSSFTGTVAEAATHLGVTATEPVVAPVVETSDIKATYAVKTGCALQALINFKGSVYGKSTAEDLHDHIWSDPTLAAYKEYDIN